MHWRGWRLSGAAVSAPGNPMGWHFGRHTDRATGLRHWFKPFTVEWDFTCAGTGKKGSHSC